MLVRALIISVSLIIFSCSNEKPIDSRSIKYSHYFFKTLKIEEQNSKKQFFIVLNPNYFCLSCYHKVAETLKKMVQKKHLYLITDSEVKRVVGEPKNLIVDDNLLFLKEIPEDRFQSSFVAIKDNEIVFYRALTTTNADSIPMFCKM